MAQAVMVAPQEVPQMKMTSVVDDHDDHEHDGIISHHFKKNRIQVSNTKKPLFFYLNLAKRYIKQHNDVELSALGMAIPTVVTIAEILKANGVATEKKVLTSTVGSKDENKGRVVQKAKLEIVLEKTDKSGSPRSPSEAVQKQKSGSPKSKLAAKTEAKPEDGDAGTAPEPETIKETEAETKEG